MQAENFGEGDETAGSNIEVDVNAWAKNAIQSAR